MAFSEDKITEYLYVDEPRLEAYVDQFSGKINKSRSINWKFRLSLPPSIEAGIDYDVQELSRHTKVILLQNFLRKNNQLYELKDGKRLEVYKDFFLIEGSGRRVIIPPTPDMSFKGLALWFMKIPLHVDRLVLLEDYPRSDNDVLQPSSAFSTLRALYWSTEKQFGRKITHHLPEFKVEATSLTIPYNPIEEEFVIEPIQTLKKLGSQIGDERKIQVLGRIRANYIETSQRTGNDLRGDHTVFCYPIVIATP